MHTGLFLSEKSVTCTVVKFFTIPVFLESPDLKRLNMTGHSTIDPNSDILNVSPQEEKSKKPKGNV